MADNPTQVHFHTNNNTAINKKFPFKFKLPNLAANPTPNNTTPAFPINLNHFHPFVFSNASSASGVDSAANSSATQHTRLHDSPADTPNAPSSSSSTNRVTHHRPLTRPVSDSSLNLATPVPKPVERATSSHGPSLPHDPDPIDNSRQPLIDHQHSPNNQLLIRHEEPTSTSIFNALTPIPEEDQHDFLHTHNLLFPSTSSSKSLRGIHHPRSDSTEPGPDRRNISPSLSTRPAKRPKVSISMDPGTITDAIDQLAEDCDSYQSKVADLQSELLDLNSTVHQLEDQLNGAQLTNAKLSKDLDLELASNRLVKQNLKTHSNQLLEYQNSHAQLKTQVATFDLLKDELSAKVNSLQLELCAAVSERDRLASQLDSTANQHKLMGDLESKLNTSSESVRDAIRLVDTRIDSVHTSVNQYSNRLAALDRNFITVQELVHKSIDSVDCVVPQVSEKFVNLQTHVTAIVPEVSDILESSSSQMNDQISNLCTVVTGLSQVIQGNMANTVHKSEMAQSELENVNRKHAVVTCELNHARNSIAQLESKLTKVHDEYTDKVKQLECAHELANQATLSDVTDLQNQLQVLVHDNQILVQDMANLQETHSNEVRSLETRSKEAAHEQKIIAQSLQEAQQALGTVPVISQLTELTEKCSTCLTQAHAMAELKYDQVLDVSHHNQTRMGQLEDRIVGTLEQLRSLTTDDMRKLHSFFVESSGASEDRRRRDISQVLDEVSKVTESLLAIHDHVPAAVVTRILDKCVTENLVIATNTSTAMGNGSNGAYTRMDEAASMPGRAPVISMFNELASMEKAAALHQFFNSEPYRQHPSLLNTNQQQHSYTQKPAASSSGLLPEAGFIQDTTCDPRTIMKEPVRKPGHTPSKNYAIISTQSDSESDTTATQMETETRVEKENASEIPVPNEEPTKGQGKPPAVRDPFAFPNPSLSPKSDETSSIQQINLRSSSHSAPPMSKSVLKPITRTQKRVQFVSSRSGGSLLVDSQEDEEEEEEESEQEVVKKKRARALVTGPKKPLRAPPVRSRRKP